MKKIGLFLLLSIGIAYGAIQSGIGKNYIKKILIQELETSGFSVQIDRIEGALPHQIQLQGVSLQGNGIGLQIEEISLRPVLWRLLKKQAAFDDIKAKHISIDKETPFSFSGKFRADRKKIYLKGELFGIQTTLRFEKPTRTLLFTARHPLFFANGKGTWNSRWELASSEIEARSDQLLSPLPFDAEGKFSTRFQIEQKEGEYSIKNSWKIEDLSVEKKKWGEIKGKGEAIWKERTLTASLDIESGAEARFDLTFLPGWIIEGSSEITIQNLQSLLIPELYGKLKIKGKWERDGKEQELHLEAEGEDLYWGPLYAQNISIDSDLKNPFGSISGLIYGEAKKFKWGDLKVEAMSFETKQLEEKWAFQFFGEGEFRHRFKLGMDGFWKEWISVDVEHLSGTFLETPFFLLDPILFEQTKTLFRIPEARLQIGDGSGSVQIQREGNETYAQILFEGIPLELFSLNPFDVKIGGTLDFQAALQQKNKGVEGTLRSSIRQTEPFDAMGKIEGNFTESLLNLQGDFAVRTDPLLSFDLSVPIRFSIWPLQTELLYHEESKGNIALNGRIEEFFDFLDLGPHRIEGICQGSFSFTNTLFHPLVEGKMTIQKGFYENYYTGTILQEIDADFLAEKNTIYLRRFRAKDPLGSGSVSATGEIELLKSDLYPFRIEAALDRLAFAQIDLVTASASGTVEIEGNALSAIAKGEIQIEECGLQIPDHIRRPLPHLDVVYRNPIQPILPPSNPHQRYPLYLDLHLSAPARIFISGRGLSSEWKGDFQIGGTYNALSAKGKLELIDGEFNFSSRSFKLTDGSLFLSGKEHQLPYINIAGSMETKGIDITARLKGPLDNPQITLQSSPPLPLGSIMSYLLFGQDISEIGGFQALQIASSLASLAGAGPDVMENTRRSLGVDRLRIITDPTEEGGETVSLQVGKYISKGVLVSFTQGADESSTNISVEVELKNHFVFQIESDQRQEQGKFTLKWNLNY